MNMKPVQAFLLSALFAALLLPVIAFAQESPVGLWKTIDDKTGQPTSIVHITEAQGTLSGKIDKLMRKPDEDQNPLCQECPGELKNKPIIGLTLLSDMKKDNDQGVWSGGTILDPKNGKVYKSKIELIEGGKKLSVRGYIGIPMLGRSQVWERME